MSKLLNISEMIAQSQESQLIVIYGTPDSGKSTMAQTISRNYKTFYIDSESKFGAVWGKIPDKNKNPENIAGKSLKFLDDVLNCVRSGEVDSFDFLVIDSLTDMSDRGSVLHERKSYKSGLGTKKTQYQFYTDLPIYVSELMEECDKRGVHVILTFQATNIHKDTTIVSGEKISTEVVKNWKISSAGNGLGKYIDKKGDLVFFIENKGKSKRRVWLDTASEFAMTKSKLLKEDHPEFMDFNGLNSFSIYSILDGVKLTKKTVEKLDAEQLKSLKESIASLTEIYPEFKIELLLTHYFPYAKTIEEINSFDYDKVQGLIAAKAKQLTINPKKDEK